MEEPDICIPGQRLCLADKENISGCGTYERNGYIYSTLAGVVKIVKNEKSSIIEVHSINERSIVPAPGDIVTAEVHTVNQRFCKCMIKCIGDRALTRTYRGILRKEDVNAFHKELVEMDKCFHSGDIILARVLPFVDIHTYQLSTAENELGVVIAHSEEGHPMVPVSWTEMMCPKTSVKEYRKVAKVVSEDKVLEAMESTDVAISMEISS